jgi:NDP-sugar pyrophosphorylase family protein
MMGARKIQLVIPMAGLGSRFSDAGYTVPKPLLDIHGAHMFQVVLANLVNDFICKVVLIVPKIWNLSDDFRSLESALGIAVEVVEVEGLTDGPAGSVEMAKKYLDPSLPVVTANSDQYLDADLTEFYGDVVGGQYAGVILAMEDKDPKWSYAKVDETGKLMEVREKVVISNLATVGVYGFESASIMFDAIDRMREDEASVNGEYYVGPSYNYILTEKGGVAVTNLGPVGDIMHGLGIPRDYESFMLTGTSKYAAGLANSIFHNDMM